VVVAGLLLIANGGLFVVPAGGLGVVLTGDGEVGRFADHVVCWERDVGEW
jgi:hypothetical protein